MTTSLSAANLQAANRRGIAAMSCGMASFVANDALVKYVSQSLPAGQLIFVRGLFSLVLLLIAAHALGATRRFRDVWQRRVVGRASLDALATMTYLTSLFHLPLGNATAINMATPLFITLFAVLALHERVGLSRWVALSAGFAGVLLIIQPNAAAFNAYALLCLAGTLLHAGRDLSTRYIDAAIPSILITLSTSIAVTLLSGAWCLVEGWQPMSTAHIGLLGGASIFLSVGYYLLILSMRDGDISLVAPFRYTGLIFALVLGWAVWGDVPNVLSWAGLALLVGAGLHVLHGERGRARAALEAAAD